MKHLQPAGHGEGLRQSRVRTGRRRLCQARSTPRSPGSARLGAAPLGAPGARPPPQPARAPLAACLPAPFLVGCLGPACRIYTPPQQGRGSPSSVLLGTSDHRAPGLSAPARPSSLPRELRSHRAPRGALRSARPPAELWGLGAPGPVPPRNGPEVHHHARTRGRWAGWDAVPARLRGPRRRPSGATGARPGSTREVHQLSPVGTRGARPRAALGPGRERARRGGAAGLRAAGRGRGQCRAGTRCRCPAAFHRALAVGDECAGLPLRSDPSRPAARIGQVNLITDFPKCKHLNLGLCPARTGSRRLPEINPGSAAACREEGETPGRSSESSPGSCWDSRGPRSPRCPSGTDSGHGTAASPPGRTCRPRVRPLHPLARVARKAEQGMEGRSEAGEAGADSGEREIRSENPNIAMASERIAAFLSPGWLNEPEACDIKLLALNSLQFIVTGRVLGTKLPRTKSHLWGHTCEPPLPTQPRGQQPAQPSALSCP